MNRAERRSLMRGKLTKDAEKLLRHMVRASLKAYGLEGTDDQVDGGMELISVGLAVVLKDGDRYRLSITQEGRAAASFLRMH